MLPLTALSVLLSGLFIGAGLAETAPAAAPPTVAPSTAAPATGMSDEDMTMLYAYCAAMLETLRAEDPAMVAGIAPSVDQALLAQAQSRVPSWQLGLPLRKAQMQGAGDARQLVGKRAMLDRLSPEKDNREVATEFARCWEMIQPWVRQTPK
ncbi:MAG TPA: hypothetical protein VGC16_07090 [Rhizomicrobium sp.]